VRRGGSCNCETHSITPHGDGTHTEGIGHLLKERVPVGPLMTEALVPALVVTVTPARLDSVTDDVSGNHAPDDRVIDQLSLQEAIARARKQDPSVQTRALIVRTQAPRAAHGENPAYFTVDAALIVREAGFEHVLVDLPSLDRAHDGGLLAAHRAFFDLPARATSIKGPPPRRTITELCAIPATLKDGVYALALQLAPLEADAVPSRPLLYPLVHAPVGFGAAPLRP
jgi:arylformamidase